MRFFGWLFLATLSLVLMVQLRLIDGALASPDTPWGMVGFELAFTRERAAAMIAVWSSMGVTDSAMIGHAGTVPLAASAFASNIFNIFYVMGIGLMLPVAVNW